MLWNFCERLLIECAWDVGTEVVAFALSSVLHGERVSCRDTNTTMPSPNRPRVYPCSILQAPDQLAHSPEEKFFELPESHLEDSGLPIISRVLFCREQFHSLFEFLNSVLCILRE